MSCFGPRRGRRGASERQRSRRWRQRDVTPPRRRRCDPTRVYAPREGTETVPDHVERPRRAAQVFYVDLISLECTTDGDVESVPKWACLARRKSGAIPEAKWSSPPDSILGRPTRDAVVVVAFLRNPRSEATPKKLERPRHLARPPDTPAPVVRAIPTRDMGWGLGAGWRVSSALSPLWGSQARIGVRKSNLFVVHLKMTILTPKTRPFFSVAGRQP